MSTPTATPPTTAAPSTKEQAVAHLDGILKQAEAAGLAGKPGFNPFFKKAEFDAIKRELKSNDPKAVEAAIKKAGEYKYSEDLFKVHAPKELPKDNPESKPAPASSITSVTKVPLT